MKQSLVDLVQSCSKKAQRNFGYMTEFVKIWIEEFTKLPDQKYAW